jgi:hypothetical protein
VVIQSADGQVNLEEYDRYDVSLLSSALRREEKQLILEAGRERLNYWQQVGMVILTWVSILSIFALLLFIGLKLFNYFSENDPFDNFFEPPEPKALSSKPENIQTSYTQFIREFLLSGETLVTGKTFEPGNNQAVSQYCYLESIGGNASVGANYLAELIDREIVFYTNESDLRQMVESKCQFDFYEPVD